MKKKMISIVTTLTLMTAGSIFVDAAWVEPKTEISRGNTERETPNEEQQIHSYLTGKLTDAQIASKRPISVMINNIINAIPQSGIANADVIYEAPVEGDITRLLAVFEDYQELDKIGPVRSCRDYYIDFAMEFDAIYTHFGQAVYAFDLLNSAMVNNISGLQYQESAGELNGYAGEDIFYRTEDRVAPHNVYTSYEGLMTAIERKGYSLEYDDDYTGHFNFAEDGTIVNCLDGEATYIRPSLYSNEPYFEYDAETKLYNRFQYGNAQIDDQTGEQLTFTNVIIQYCEVSAYDENGYLDVDTNLGGDAVIFTNGTYEYCTWEKASDWGPARYYDMNGDEMIINQGKTWVCIVANNRSSDTYFE